MNREIKFRGKSIHDGQWLYGLLNKGINGDEGKWYIAEHGLYSNVEVDPATIGQWTGRQDSKGKDIWEGDKIEFDKKEWGGDDNVHEVTWDNENSEWCWGGGSSGDMEFRTVIGSVHDKPNKQ